jgi:hypothetical protein
MSVDAFIKTHGKAALVERLSQPPSADDLAWWQATRSKTMTLPAFKADEKYGMWGYSGFCCDLAIRRDDPALMNECINRGYIDVDTRMVFGSVMDHCQRHAPRCWSLLMSRAEESKKIPPAPATEHES